MGITKFHMLDHLPIDLDRTCGLEYMKRYLYLNGTCKFKGGLQRREPKQKLLKPWLFMKIVCSENIEQKVV